MGYRALDLDPNRIVSRVAQNVRSTRRRFARNYRAELEDADSVRVVLNTNLVEIELGEADRVEGLALRTLTGVALRAKARSYAIAGGGIENARLLPGPGRR